MEHLLRRGEVVRPRARILNAIPANKLFNRPFPVNFCPPPNAAKTVHRVMRPWMKRRKEQHLPNKIYVVSIDWRHYYHQLKTCDYLKTFFGLAIRKNGKANYYMWGFVPMGWSWAPYAAQCLGWHFVLHKNPLLPSKLEHLEAPPVYMKTRNNDGLTFLYLDNVHAYLPSLEAGEEFLLAVFRNMAWYNVELKYAWLDGKRYTYTYDKEATTSESCRASVQLVRTGEERQYPDALGLEFECSDGVFKARIEEARLSKLPSLEEAMKLCTTPKMLARVVCRVLYRLSLQFRMHPSTGPMLKLLSKAGKHAARHKQGKWWNDPSLNLKEGEEKDLSAAYQELLNNAFMDVGPEENDDCPRVYFAASDACNRGAGWALYGSFDINNVPKNAPRVSCTVRMFEGRSWTCGRMLSENPGSFAGLRTLFSIGSPFHWLRPLHIYIQEIYAACECVKAICASGEKNVLIVLAVDSSSARSALNRGLSLNEFACVMIIDMQLALTKANNSLDCVPIPGHFNIGDWPSRDAMHEIIPLAGGGYAPVRKPAPKGKPKSWGEPFDPVAVTWEYLLEGFRGQRRKIQPDEHNKAGIVHAEPAEAAMEESLLDETLHEWVAKLTDDHLAEDPEPVEDLRGETERGPRNRDADGKDE